MSTAPPCTNYAGERDARNPDLPALKERNFWLTVEETYSYRLLLIELQARIGTELGMMAALNTDKFGRYPKMYTNMSATLEGNLRRGEVTKKMLELLVAATAAHNAFVAEAEAASVVAAAAPKKKVTK